jgi:hypothetical protein
LVLVVRQLLLFLPCLTRQPQGTTEATVLSPVQEFLQSLVVAVLVAQRAKDHLLLEVLAGVPLTETLISPAAQAGLLREQYLALVAAVLLVGVAQAIVVAMLLLLPQYALVVAAVLVEMAEMFQVAVVVAVAPAVRLLVRQLVLQPLAMVSFLQSLRTIAMVKVALLVMPQQSLMRLRLAILLTRAALVAGVVVQVRAVLALLLVAEAGLLDLVVLITQPAQVAQVAEAGAL